MNKPVVCAAITSNNVEAVKAAEPLVDMFEVRIDLIGEGWQALAAQLEKPWIACNRTREEGGNWQDSEARRKEELLKAVRLGAAMVDIELATKNLNNAVSLIKKGARCIISSHNLKETPPLDELEKIVKKELAAGADICKVVTIAQKAEDNLTILSLIPEFPQAKIVAFAMGPMGLTSRILCPLLGGELTYAAIERGAESAPGQITVSELQNIYGMLKQ